MTPEQLDALRTILAALDELRGYMSMDMQRRVAEATAALK